MTAPPTDVTRSLEFDGARNFRDLGGYESRLGGTTRWGRLYRAGSLSRMTADDLARLAALDLDTVVDLRNDDERRLAPDPIDSVHVPVMGAFVARREPPDFSALVAHDHGVAFMRQMYLGLLEHAAPEIGLVIGLVANAVGRPVVFHCTAGKDRTGIVAALLLELLGVDRDVVLDDFTLTERYLGSPDDSDGVRQMIERGMSPEAAAGAFGAPRSTMADVLVALDDRHGGVERYLTERAGLGPATVETLRHHLLT